MSSKPMRRARVDGAELEFEITGTGEPVVLIHGALIAEAYAPLCREPALNSRYQLVRYHRRGYAGSSPVRAPFSIGQQAADCRALLEYLGIERAHVVGHSGGGVIALRPRSTRPRSSIPSSCSSRRCSTSQAEPCSSRRSEPVLERSRAGKKEECGRQLPSLGDRAGLPSLARSADPGRVPAVGCRRRPFLRRRASVIQGVALHPGGCSADHPAGPGVLWAPRASRFGLAGTRFRNGCVSGCRRPSRSCSPARTTRSRRGTPAASPRPWRRSLRATPCPCGSEPFSADHRRWARSSSRQSERLTYPGGPR